jgi:hypothetical protein
MRGLEGLEHESEVLPQCPAPTERPHSAGFEKQFLPPANPPMSFMCPNNLVRGAGCESMWLLATAAGAGAVGVQAVTFPVPVSALLLPHGQKTYDASLL